jgi:hypothetical protein
METVTATSIYHKGRNFHGKKKSDTPDGERGVGCAEQVQQSFFPIQNFRGSVEEVPPLCQ